jgi:hypothetical protein
MAKKNITAQNIEQEVKNPANWSSTRKRNYKIYMCIPTNGTKVTNVLEGANYIVGPKGTEIKPGVKCNGEVVLSGTAKEQWVTPLSKVADTYGFGMDRRPIDLESFDTELKRSDTPGWVEITTKSNGSICNNYALFLPLKEIRNFPVQTAWGSTLYANRDGIKHGKGDFLVCSKKDGKPDFTDVWVVNGEIFPTTYITNYLPADIQEMIETEQEKADRKAGKKKEEDDSKATTLPSAPKPLNKYPYYKDAVKKQPQQPVQVKAPTPAPQPQQNTDAARAEKLKKKAEAIKNMIEATLRKHESMGKYKLATLEELEPDKSAIVGYKIKLDIDDDSTHDLQITFTTGNKIVLNTNNSFRRGTAVWRENEDMSQDKHCETTSVTFNGISQSNIDEAVKYLLLLI